MMTTTMVRMISFQTMMATMIMVIVMPMVTRVIMATMLTMEMTKMMELPGVYRAGGKCEWVRYDRLSHPHRHFYMYYHLPIY